VPSAPRLPSAPDPFPRRHAEVALGGLAAGLSLTSTLLHRRPGEQAAITVGSAVLGAGAGLLSETAVQAVGRRTGGERPGRAALIALGIVATASRAQRSDQELLALAATLAQVAGTGAALGWATPPRRRYRPTMVDGAAIVLLAVSVHELQRRRKARRLAGRVFLRQYPVQRWLDTVSGGPGSLAPRDTLDFEGTRFVGGAVPAEDIVALLGGGTAIDPIRVFVGVKTAPTPEERAGIAVDELERLGAFGRARLLVCSPPLRGYVNPVPVKTHEVLSRGDVASVTVQYYDQRTVLMPLKVPIAAKTHRLVLELLRDRLAARRAAGVHVPEVQVYGESLGAWASQDVFLHGGLKALDELAVGRALWAGTPAFSRLRRWFASGRLARDERIAFVRVRDLPELPADVRDALRFLFLYRRVDPVVLFSGVDLLWRRPAWLDADRADRWTELRRVRWVPGVTFLQLAGDLFRATNWTNAPPQDAAHDYRLEMPLAVNVAFAHGRAPAEIDPIAERIIVREVGSLQRLRALNRGLPDPGLPEYVGPRDPLGQADPTAGHVEPPIPMEDQRPFRPVDAVRNRLAGHRTTLRTGRAKAAGAAVAARERTRAPLRSLRRLLPTDPAGTGAAHEAEPGTNGPRRPGD